MSAIDEILATLRALPKLPKVDPDVRGFLVAPDVWDRLCTEIPICRGSSFTVDGLKVQRSALVPAGHAIPLDAKGNPLLKPRKNGPSAPSGTDTPSQTVEKSNG